jgi:hypothetical protein
MRARIGAREKEVRFRAADIEWQLGIYGDFTVDVVEETSRDLRHGVLHARLHSGILLPELGHHLRVVRHAVVVAIPSPPLPAPPAARCIRRG